MAAGRDVLAISVSKEHARALHALYPQTSAILDGEVKAGQRLDDLRTHTLSFATVECTYEALNKKSLDTLILLTEVSSESRLTQAVGRILRYHKGKKPPLVIVLLHHNVPEMQRSGRQILRLFKEWNLAITVIDPGKKGSVRDETVAQGCR
jgi:superfamily II DNA or RNA helicase